MIKINCFQHLNGDGEVKMDIVKSSIKEITMNDLYTWCCFLIKLFSLESWGKKEGGSEF